MIFGPIDRALRIYVDTAGNCIAGQVVWFSTEELSAEKKVFRAVPFQTTHEMLQFLEQRKPESYLDKLPGSRSEFG